MSGEERRPKEKKDKQKKRKRHAEDEEQPRKKRATESIAENLNFSIVEGTAESAPAICEFFYNFSKLYLRTMSLITV